MKRSKKEMPEINTTALPDIIFMLLFFFMVVTVIKKSPNSADLTLPTLNDSTELRADKNNLVLHLYKTGNDELVVKIDGSKIKMKYDEKDIKYAIHQNNLSKEEPIEKVLLLIDSHVPMKKVNGLKRILQELELYKVEYLNDKTFADVN